MKRSQALSILSQKMIVQNYALDTVKSYSAAVGKFFSYVVSHPVLKTKSHKERIESFLTHRVQTDDISASTQNVEFNALIYFHREVLHVDVQGIDSLRAKPKLRIPPILTKEQVLELINTLPEEYQLIGRILYGVGLRVNEVLRLRIKDVDFSLRKLVIHESKGDKERTVPIPDSLFSPITTQYNASINLWRGDHVTGHGVNLPRALEKKYKTLGLSKEWYWLFPAPATSIDPRSHRTQRHHIKDFTVQKAFAETRRSLKLPEYATPHALRHAFATHLTQDMLAKNFPREMIEKKLIEYLGHASRETLKFYVHLAAPKDTVITLPIDSLVMEKEP